MYRSHTREQEEIIAKMKRQLSEAEVKIQQQAREFDVYKGQLHTRPEVQLQAEIHKLTLEKVRCIQLHIIIIIIHSFWPIDRTQLNINNAEMYNTVIKYGKW